MGSNNRSHTGHHTNTQQQRSQLQQSHNNHMQHLNNQKQQHHSHGHPHISDYSPEWGWSDATERAGCFTCRKREASPAIGGPGLPAKLPTGNNPSVGSSGSNSSFSTTTSNN